MIVVALVFAAGCSITSPPPVLSGVNVALPELAQTSSTVDASDSTVQRMGRGTSSSFRWDDATLSVRWRRSQATCDPVTVLTSDGEQSFNVGTQWVSTQIPVRTGSEVTVQAGDCALTVDHLSSHVRPFSGATLFVPASPADQAANDTTAAGEAAGTVANTPTAVWLTDTTTAVGTAIDTLDAAAAADQVGVLVVYMLPSRDCGGFSAGGAGGGDEYRAAVTGVADQIMGQDTLVIIEPDGTSLDCVDHAQTDALLTFAVDAFADQPGTRVYLDAGHPDWLPVPTQLDRLRSAGVAGADGVAVNVSNFAAPDVAESYGAEIAQALGTGFVTDLSRAGGTVGPGQWCNPPGARVGPHPTLEPASPLNDARLWVKRPGESDGTCEGGPSAGTWWPQGAANLFS